MALLSHAADERGERLDPASIETRIVERLTYIAFRWYCCGDATTEALDTVEPRVLMLPIALRAPQFVKFMDHRGAVEPVWSRKGTAVLETFGARPPYDDIVLVAAFPSGVLQAGRPFVIYKDAGVAQGVITGIVRADDAAPWR